jgi:beta-lactamase superfamily II metal-dependent hydrolase
MPDASRGAGEWVARYVKRAAGEDAVIDYAVATHFHGDHIGNPQPARKKSAEGGYSIVGLAEVSEQVPIRKLIDRGYPEYGEPATPAGEIIENYRRFAAYAAKTRGMQRERIRVGRRDQIRLVHEATAFPQVEVRAVAGNGDVWTGAGDGIEPHFPPQKELPAEDRASENPCSIALQIRYGAFSWFTGGDLYGVPEPGAPAWWNLETPIAKAIGRTDVMVVNHHGSIEPANPFFLGALQPRVIVVPAWSPTHPSPDVLKRLLSTRIWSAPRDVFVTRLRDATKATIGPRATKVASGAGHVVVRVEPGGASYRVYVIDDEDESGRVKSVHGPYASGAR